MANITYLLGAGASAPTLPIVKEIPEKIGELIFKLTNYVENVDQETLKNSEDLIHDLIWLKQQSQKHSSIDTCAKKFFLNEQNSDLRRLKKGLSAFLYYQQEISPVERRYDTFFASVLKKTKNGGVRDTFPQNIKILSWNYDYQFEKSYLEYYPKHFEQSYRAARYALNCKGSHNFEDNFSFFKEQFFEILKLNGSCHNYSYGQSRREYDEYELLEMACEKSIFSHLINSYSEFKNNNRSGIQFAWEDKPSLEPLNETNYIQYINERIQATNVMVVIGYSFPFFNRDIDKALFADLKLDKIYIQDLYPDNIKTKLLSTSPKIDPTIIETMTYVDEFYLPPEL